MTARETIRREASCVLSPHPNTLKYSLLDIRASKDLTELWSAEFSGTVRLEKLYEAIGTEARRAETTLDVSAVNPAEFSLVWRPLCGPGFGFCPFKNASNIFFVVSAVRSSYSGGGL